MVRILFDIATMTDATVGNYYSNTNNSGDLYLLLFAFCLFAVALVSHKMFRKMFNELRNGSKGE